ncbi:MAG: hypothetical protein Q9181_006638, partial [Wetmoreana brouardii]
SAEEKCVSVADVKPDFMVNESSDSSTSELVLSAYLRQVTIRDNLAVDGFFPHQTFNNKKQLLVHHGSQQLMVGDSKFSYHPAVSYTLDNNILSEINEAYFLPLTWTTNDKDRSSSEMSGLLLDSTGGPSTFKRIGTLHIRGYAAIVFKYQLKQEVNDSAEVWDAFNKRLRYRCSKAASDDVIPEAHSRLSNSATADLYDHNWISDTTNLEMLEPQDIFLQ